MIIDLLLDLTLCISEILLLSLLLEFGIALFGGDGTYGIGGSQTSYRTGILFSDSGNVGE